MREPRSRGRWLALALCSGVVGASSLGAAAPEGGQRDPDRFGGAGGASALLWGELGHVAPPPAGWTASGDGPHSVETAPRRTRDGLSDGPPFASAVRPEGSGEARRRAGIRLFGLTAVPSNAPPGS